MESFQIVDDKYRVANINPNDSRSDKLAPCAYRYRRLDKNGQLRIF